ncbi:MAG: FadR family transcriptional regulator, partial [Clostridium sp.]|nr:FadR family transcriptional regulator [Clostridium sp.]
MLNPVKNIKVYEAIIEQIKDSVKNGELKSGDKLPS